MNGRFKLSSQKLSVVIAVALAAMLIVTVTVFTVALAKIGRDDQTKPPIDDGDDIGQNPPQGDDVGNGQIPDTDEKDEKPSDDPSDDTGKNEKPGNNDQETIVPVPDEPKWSYPVEGYVFKPHSTEELVYSLTLGDYRTHSGIDISASAGSEVKACLDGKIEGVYYDPFMGYCVSIEHKDGVVSHYKNLGDALPESIIEGKEVKSGEVIGYVGESAMVEFSDEAHLHFELEISGNSADPLEYLEYSDKPSNIEQE